MLTDIGSACSAVQCSAMQCSAVQCSAQPCEHWPEVKFPLAGCMLRDCNNRMRFHHNGFKPFLLFMPAVLELRPEVGRSPVQRVGTRNGSGGRQPPVPGRRLVCKLSLVTWARRVGGSRWPGYRSIGSRWRRTCRCNMAMLHAGPDHF
jgi:hypothetical protein